MVLVATLAASVSCHHAVVSPRPAIKQVTPVDPQWRHFVATDNLGDAVFRRWGLNWLDDVSLLEHSVAPAQARLRVRVSGFGGFVSTEYRRYDGQWGAEQFCARGDCARKAPPHGMWRTRVSAEHGQLLERCVGTLLAHPLLAIEASADAPAMLDGYAAEVQYIDERNRFTVYRNHPNFDSEKRSLVAFMTCVCAMIDPTGDSGQSVLYGDCALFK